MSFDVQMAFKSPKILTFKIEVGATENKSDFFEYFEGFHKITKRKNTNFQMFDNSAPSVGSLANHLLTLNQI